MTSAPLSLVDVCEAAKSVARTTADTGDDGIVTSALRQFRMDDLRAFDGSKPGVPIYLAILGQVYDVTPGMKFYGPGQY